MASPDPAVLTRLADRFTSTGDRFPDLGAYVWFDPENATVIEAHEVATHLPPFVVPLTPTSFEPSVFDTAGYSGRWSIAYFAAPHTAAADRRAALLSFCTLAGEAVRVLALSGDDCRPRDPGGLVVSHLAELPSVQAVGRHPNGNAWVSRDGTTYTAGDGARPSEAYRLMQADKVRGKPSLDCWCAHIPNLLLEAAGWLIPRSVGLPDKSVDGCTSLVSYLSGRIVASPDFRTVRRGGTEWVFTSTQAKAVKFMVEASAHYMVDANVKRLRTFHGGEVLDNAESTASELRSVFKGDRLHEAWGDLIVAVKERKGHVRLNLEESSHPGENPG